VVLVSILPPLELSPLFGQRLPPAAACLRLQFAQSVSSTATAASVALDTNRNAARPALQNRRSHSSNCALHPCSSRHRLAWAALFGKLALALNTS